MTEINFDRIPREYPTLCIPRALSDFRRGSALTKGDVARTFEQLNIGKIGAIQIEDNEDPKFCRIFVHFVEWYRTPLANKARDRVLQGESIKVVYYGDNYWKAVKSKFDELKDSRRSDNRRSDKPRLILDDDDEDRRPRRYNDDRRRDGDRDRRRDGDRDRRRDERRPRPSDKLEDTLAKMSISEAQPSPSIPPRPRSPLEEGEYDIDVDEDPNELYTNLDIDAI
jgi:hypothetical protein